VIKDERHPFHFKNGMGVFKTAGMISSEFKDNLKRIVTKQK